MTTVMLACLDTPGPNPTNPPPTPPPPPPPPGLVRPTGRAQRPSTSAAMHLHGLSNHGANSRPASIAWHTQQYASGGVELLWWTDHADSYFGRLSDLRITPKTPAEVFPHTWSVGVWGPNAGGKAFVKSVSLPVVDSARGYVSILLPTGNPQEADTVELSMGILGGDGKIKNPAYTVLSRPLVGLPQFAMNVWRADTNTNAVSASVLIPLSWHPRSNSGYRQVLRYEFAAVSDTSTTAHGDTLVMSRGWTGTDTLAISIQPAVDAALFSDGIDNTMTEYRVQLVVARSSAPAQLSFSFPTLINTKSSAAAQMPTAIDLAHAMASAYGTRAMWGLELGPRAGALAGTKWQSVYSAGGHMTVFLPDDISPTLETSLVGTPPEVAAVVKSLGGVSAIAHPFGTSTAAPVGTEAQQRQAAYELGAFLVQHQAWRSNLIEVGSIRRGLIGLRGHLDLLDYLWASGFRSCGIAVTDSHGGQFLSDPVPGTEDQYNFVTWLGDVDRWGSATQFVAALRSCDVSFGDPFYTNGGLWIDLHTDGAGHQVASFDAAGVSPSADLFLYEAEIDSSATGHSPVYRRYGQRVARTDSVLVGGCKPGFVRLEAWAGSRPIAFSNLAFLPPDPSRCTAGSAASH